MAVKFCPKIFRLKADSPGPMMFQLEYAMVFAIATVQSVIIYST